MLSRVADALYWMGRYIERAENVTRLLMVTTELAIEVEGLDDRRAQSEWDELLAGVSGSAPENLDFSPDSGLALPYIRWLLLDEDNPVSVRHSLGRARANARSIREALTREVFEDLNEGYRDLLALGGRLADPVEAYDDVARTHRDLRTMLGAIEHTLSRDEGWTFMKLGEAMERTQRTLLVLRAKLPSLRAERPAEDLPLFFARWRAVLRSLASLENYRAAHGADLEPGRVLQFLLLEITAPRSLLCGLTRLRSYLARLPRGETASEAERVLGRLEAALRYDHESILQGDVAKFFGDASEKLVVAHEAISQQYFLQ